MEQKKTRFKLLAIGLGVVALLVGGKMYVDHAEQAALEQQRQEQAFVEEVGRVPDPQEKTDLHVAARLNLPVLT